MKKTVMAVAVVGVAIAFAMNAFALEVKETVKTTGDATVETTEVKGEGVKAKRTVTTTEEGTLTEGKMKTKEVKMERKELDTPEGAVGMAKFEAKKGAIKDFNIEWKYFMDENQNYVIEYTIKDKTDKELLDALGLTATQAELIRPGMHRIVSTSPYTMGDVRANFQDVIVKDIAAAVKKK